MAWLLELRGNDRPGIHGGDAEGNEGGRHMYVLERTAHGVLAADGGQSEGRLHFDCTQKGSKRLAPCMGVGSHALEVLLVRETHSGPVGAGTGNLGASLNY